MNVLGIIGIVVGLLAIIYLSLKRVNPVIAAPAASLLVILFNQMQIFESLVGTEKSFMTAVAGFLVTNFAVFLLGSILAKYMERSGATVSIANFILNKIGTDKPYSVLVALFVISAFLTYGGISMFVVCFALIPMARPIFKRLNLPWNLVTLPIFAGMATFTLSMLPGTPAGSNFIPANTLGTPLTAAPLIGIVTSLIVIVYLLVYMKFALNKVMAKGETYEMIGMDTDSGEDTNMDNIPSIGLSVLPIFALIFTVIVFSSHPNIVLIALTLAIVLSAILFNKQLPNQLEVLNEGAGGSIVPTFSTATTVAFGTILTSAPAFLMIQGSIQGVSTNPLISLAISTVLLSFVTGSGVGTIGIVMNTFADSYLAMGVSAEILHRVSAIASGVFGVMPHTGLVITFNNIAKLDLKQSYKYQFMTTNVGHFIALIVAIAMATFM